LTNLYKQFTLFSFNKGNKMATAKKPVTTQAKKVSPVKKVASKKATPVKTVSKKPVKPVAQPAKVVKLEKIKKPKLVRDSFTIPKDEYAAIDSLKQRAIKLGQVAKKSELLRAGIKALSSMSDIQFKAALSNVPTIKTGRPKSAK
jgi:hypothetical protein